MQEVDLSGLTEGQQYIFHTKDFEVPAGGCIPGEAKVRTFLRMEVLGAVGCPKFDCVAVRRADGSEHLIAVEMLRSIEKA